METPLGSLLQGMTSCTVKALMVSVFQLVPGASLFHLILLRSVWVHLLYSLNPTPIRYWYTLRSPWSFFWGWRVPLLNLLMNNRCSNPFCNFHGLWLESLKYVLVSLVLRSLEPNPTLSLVLSRGTRSPHPTCCRSSRCNTTIWCISHSFQFCISCKLAADALSHHPGHLWRHQTVLALVVTPGYISGLQLVFVPVNTTLYAPKPQFSIHNAYLHVCNQLFISLSMRQ